MSVCFIEHKTICVSNQYTRGLNFLTMPCQQDICRRRHPKTTKPTLIEPSRGISIHLSSNNTPSSPPSGHGSKRKALSAEKSVDELTAGIGDDSSLSPF